MMFRKILLALGMLSSAGAHSSVVTDEEISKNYGVIDQAASLFLNSLGPQFTNTEMGHIETDIAGASAMAGLFVLRSAIPNLNEQDPGMIIISDVHEDQNRLLNFMQRISHGMKLDAATGWKDPIPDKHRPLKDTPILSKELEKPFVLACQSAKLEPRFWPYAAALTAMKLVLAGTQMKLLDESTGKSIAAYYMVAGSKTVPAQ